ncbi:MAG: MaoC family dehydratase N-terminal domain-containing protein [Promethearchaeota archaeon]
MDEAEMKKNAQFLIENLSGKEIPGSHSLTVRYKSLVNFAKVFGITDPKYVGSEDEVIACHAFANHYTIKSLYTLLLGMKLEQDGKERDFVLNLGKLLHASQKYNWDGCVDIRPGDRLTATGKWGKVWLVEENMILFAQLIVEVRNQNNELVCKPVVTAAIRSGGY